MQSKKELSKVARSETRSLLYVTNNNGNNITILKTWDPSHAHKFVTKTRDQPEPGSFFPRSLWGGEMKDPGNEVGKFMWHTRNGCGNLQRNFFANAF